MLNHAYAHTRNFYNTFLGKKLKLVHAINSDSKVGGWFGVLGNTMHGVYMVCFVRWYRVKYFHVTVAMFVYTKCIVVIDRQCFHIAVHEHRQLFQQFAFLQHIHMKSHLCTPCLRICLWSCTVMSKTLNLNHRNAFCVHQHGNRDTKVSQNVTELQKIYILACTLTSFK